MWGFALDTAQACNSLPAWTVGPQLTDADLVAGNLTINLRNCLTEPVSIMIPGQAMPAVAGGIAQGTLVDPQGRTRFTSFTAQAGVGDTVQYTWTGAKPGTYMYHSGSNVSKQVQMGLYGALIVNVSPGVAYTTTTPVNYDNEVVLVYSEIDPARHDPPAPAYPNAYTPRYFLINGQPYGGASTPVAIGGVGQRTIVRMLSACLDDIVPAINGIHWDLVAEDGNLYPYPKAQYTALLSAMKTLDAIIAPNAEGVYSVFDRRLHLTNAGSAPGGMLVQLEVGTVAGAPVANPDSATVGEGGTVAVLGTAESSVLANDVGVNALQAVLVSGVSKGLLTLNSDGTFSYTHNGSETNADLFTYKAVDTISGLESGVATVNITVTPVNDAPVAVNDPYEVVTGTNLTVAAPGVLGNDTDAENDTLTAAVDGIPPAGLIFNADGSFTYGPAGAAGTVVTFPYTATDDGTPPETSLPATVTITVIAAPANEVPVANPDFAQTMRNTPVAISVLANDTDPNGDALDVTSVVATQGSRGGTVIVNTNGSVTYTPKNNFRGTETFTYTVDDTGIPPLTSNPATVTVNVVR
jgi:VCBS repeat-containing protein